ncbi:hypothetical protein HOG16_00600 [Candidatus Woesearchaeota archaeon]|nr:hypothetical protein [Candidatus Woesearchaeota archaeon]
MKTKTVIIILLVIVILLAIFYGVKENVQNSPPRFKDGGGSCGGACDGESDCNQQAGCACAEGECKKLWI